MSSFFTIPNAQKKRKRNDAPEVPKKRLAAASKNSAKEPKPAKRPQRDESISGSDSESDGDQLRDDTDELALTSSDDEEEGGEEEETAAERRLKLAERYLQNIRSEVQEEVGFDAEEIDRDLIAERLQEDVAESKGRIYRKLADELKFGEASNCYFKKDSESVTSVAACAPYIYTVSKDMWLVKWKIQELPRDQYPQKKGKKGKKKSKKPTPPPRKKPTLVASVRGNKRKAKETAFMGHTDTILTVAASQDGKFVVTGGKDRKIIVWNAETLKPIRVFSQHRDAVTGLAFRRGTNQLYSSSKDRTIKIWSLDEGAYVETLFGHQDEVVDIAALAQERCISVGARDRTARLWKVVEETQLVFRGGGGEKKSRHKSNPNEPRTIEGSIDRIAMVDEEMFITGGDNGSLSLWTMHKKKPIFTISLTHGVDEPLQPDEASAEADPANIIIPQPQPRWITALTTIPYSDVVLSGSWDGVVRAWRVSPDRKSLESMGVVGRLADVSMNGTSTAETSAPKPDSQTPARGIINDIVVFERGDRGKDGICIVAAVGKTHRMGRWQVMASGRNGAVVFEVERKALSNGVKALENGSGSSGEDELR
jgi:ribosomal RNA-processing protein 9